MFERIVCLAFVSACATHVENVGNTPGNNDLPTEDHAVRWAISFDGDLVEAPQIAFAPDGDVVASVTTDWGLVSTIHSGHSAITKCAGDTGSERWTRTIAGPTSDDIVAITGLAVANDGAIMVVGGYSGTIDFGATTLHNAQYVEWDLFVAKYTSDGDEVWVQHLAADSQVESSAVAVDSTGNAFVTGQFRSTSFAFAGQTYVEADDEDDTFILAYTRDGAQRWAQVVQGPWTQFLTSVAIAPGDDVVVGGGIVGRVQLAGSTLTSGPYESGVLAKLTNDGTLIWSTLMGLDYLRTRVRSLAVGPGGEITATTHDSDSTGQHDGASVRRFEGDGSALWATTVPLWDFETRFPRTMGVFPDGRVASTQWSEGLFQAENPDANTWGSLDQVRVGNDGIIQAHEVAGNHMRRGEADTQVRALAIGSNGATALAGTFSGVIDFGVTTLTSVAPPPDVATPFWPSALIFVVEPEVARRD